nr:late embryogenesis abundant protein M17-like [Aegilops tauschii subsp. strangulata]
MRARWPGETVARAMTFEGGGCGGAGGRAGRRWSSSSIGGLVGRCRRGERPAEAGNSSRREATTMQRGSGASRGGHGCSRVAGTQAVPGQRARASDVGRQEVECSSGSRLRTMMQRRDQGDGGRGRGGRGGC